MKRSLWLSLLPAALAAGCLSMSAAHAAVKPNGLFTNGAVLQRDMRIPIWGTAAENEKVTVSIQNQRVSAVARDGKWVVRLNPLRAGGPYKLTIRGKNSIVLSNILVGEVYICSGQSNMEWPLSLAANAEEVLPQAADPMLHLYTVPKAVSETPVTDVAGQWQASAPETARGFSAVAWFFGRSLRQHLGIPVGLIHTSWGGTPAQAWTSRQTLESNPVLQPIWTDYEQQKAAYLKGMHEYQAAKDRYETDAAQAKQNGKEPPPVPRAPGNPTNQNSPGVLYNAMIAPLLPYAIRGALWYQGESNVGAAYQYQTLFHAMITNWREDWQQGDFPFFFVQLAPFQKKQDAPQESAWAELREAQRLTSLHVPNTGMAVITDVGDELDIHPRKKQPVGERLALLALAMVYKQDVEDYGPVYDSQRVEGNTIVLRFTHVGGGLEARGGELKDFTIAGEDRKFVPATAVIKGDTIVVSSPSVPHPVAVRYGWANYPQGNLWNKAGLPASPFRTDTFPMITQPK